MRRNRVRLVLLAAAVAAGSFGAAPAPADHVHGGPDLFVEVSDGTRIAINIVFPDSYDPKNPSAITFPTIFEMAGYENGSSSDEGRTYLGETEDHCNEMLGGNCPSLPLTGDSHAGTSAFRYDEDYVVVHASVRGTGCSSGEFDLFSTRAALDGVEIINNWIVKQPWSNGKVGILGHSYSGNTGFMIAALDAKLRREQPDNFPTRHVVAVTVSGMIDDLYRGITYPGGASNYLFPPLWTLGVRPAYDVLGGSVQPVLRHTTEDVARECLANTASHRRAIGQDPVLNGLFDTDGEWWRVRSNVTYAGFIDMPIHITGAHQDEQTGPRFPHLWEMIPHGVPKRLLMMNGDHGSQVDPAEVWRDRKAWMDYWMRGVPNPFVDPAQRPTSVRVLFEMHAGPDGIVSNGFKEADEFPLEDTTWTPFFLGPEATLSRHPVAAGSAVYLSGTRRQSWFYEAGPSVGPPATTRAGPDELDFVSEPFEVPTAIAGPIVADLFVSSSGNDTILFVQVTDRDPEGNVSWLQRGVLKASHRAIDYARSDYDDQPDPFDGSPRFLYRPFRPHTNPTSITPLQVYEYLVEVWPVSHVFRPGHRLQVKIMGPPAVDSYYSYAVREWPVALNTVHFGGDTPSRITLPVVPLTGVTLGEPLGCGEIDQVRCYPD